MLRKFKTFKRKIGNKEIIVREVTLGDTHLLNKIANEKSVLEFLNFDEISLKTTKNRIKKTMKDNNAEWLVLESDKKMMGSIILRRLDGRTTHVANFGIAFSHEAQGTGLAKFLMNIVLVYLKKNKVKILEASVMEDNLRARRFYEKLGFKEYGTLPMHYLKRKKYVGNILISKELK